ncbi:MAG: hypothetical protein GY928_15490 [Colwellia sp.]|nr:hypothetical protein [Colwellia sp.]
MKVGELNFFEYIGTEEQHLLKNINNFRQEFDLFYTIDRLYQEPIKRLVVPNDDIVMSPLYLFVHFHLYFSMSCLLRSHLSECLASIRKAIDASLSAYKIILEPTFSKKYSEGDNYFKYIKRSIQKEREKDTSKYPLAPELIKMHEACSQFGSHADDSSLFHRFETKEIPGTNQDQNILSYFQIPKNHEECKFYYFVTLQTFYQMFLIFKLFLDKNLEIIDPNWENIVCKLGPELQRLKDKAKSKAD